MRTRLLWLTALSLVFMGLGPIYAQDEVVNLLPNGGFEDGGIAPFGTYGTVTSEVVTELVGATIPEDIIEGNYCLHLVVDAAGANNWDMGMTDGSHVFEAGKTYTFSCFMKCKSGTLEVRMKPERAADPWENYNEIVVTVTEEWVEYHTTTGVIPADVSPASPTFHFGFAPGDFWIDAVKFYEGDYVPTTFGPRVAPENPSPESGATDVPQDVVLSWDPGEFAATHDVYFGTSFADVNTGAAGTLAGPGQAATTFDPEGLLDFGQTYYWRVDEVNAPPDSSVFAGPVWSFTVEPYTYPIENVTATASSSATAKGMTPDKTVDGSGLTGDEHSTLDTAMWLSSPLETLPAWIQYEFDDVYKLSELWVWNSNQSMESFIGFGARDVTVEYSLDGAEWTTLTDMEFAQAPGEVGYAPNTTVDMAGVRAKFVRLTIANNWMGIVQQAGLSEVRFYYIPVKASQPNPASGSRGVPLDVTLTWRSGREAASHDVYFSDDRNAVVDGTAPVENVTTARFEPSGLEFGLNYYWKVNEVSDDGSVYEGDVWSLGTTEYMVVEDFESYDDDIDAGTTIFQTWIDGLTNGSGSVVGYWEAPFAETVIVHSGRQSMPVDYNNANSPYYSEAERTFDPLQNWTVNGVEDLILWYRGYPVPFVENADGSITMSGSGHDIYDAADDFRFAYKPLNGDGSIVARVDSLVNTNAYAKAGVMIRESLMDDARCAYMVMTPVNGVEFGRRLFMGVTPETSGVAGLTTPQYVKLTRKGDVFTAFYSANGTTWQEVTTDDGSPVEISMTGNPVIGLCLTSHDSSLVTTAEFSEITSSGTGPWRVAAIGDDPQPGNGTDDLYVVVQDSSNKSAVVTNPDPAAVNANAWTEWRIPLSDLTGVNLSRVQTIYIGVGDRDNPQPDGAGRLFIDDIRVGRRGMSDPGTAGLLAYYALENDATDGSGNGRDGTAVGGPAYVEGPAGYGMAMEFDGTGAQYVDLGTWDPSAATGQLSFSMWAKWNGPTDFYQGLIGKRDGWTDQDTMWCAEMELATNDFRFFQYDSWPDHGVILLPQGEWQHVAISFNGTTVAMYIGGEAVGGDLPFEFGPATDAALVFGCCEANGGNPFNGTLDEVRLYDRALSSFEVRYLAGGE